MFKQCMFSKLVSFLMAVFILMSAFPPHAFAEEFVRENEVDEYMKKAMKEYNIPGASLAIVHKNKTVYQNSWGTTASKKTVNTKTPFLIGSISKSLTGLAIMKLIEEKKVKLNEPLQKYVPWFTMKNKHAASQITIRQLLSHTSGISGYTGFSLADMGSKDQDAIKKSVKKLSSIDLKNNPGKNYEYSDANYLLLGAVIEEVSNQSFSDYMEQTIYSPLGMNHTAADYQRSTENGYETGFQSFFGRPQKSSNSYDNGGGPYGYMNASAEDMARYLQALLNKNSIVNDKNTKALWTPLAVSNPKTKISYGFGWRIKKLNTKETLVWHGGSTPDSRSELFFIPETGWGAVILTNKNNVVEEIDLLNVSNDLQKMIHGEKPSEPVKQYTWHWLMIAIVSFLLAVLIIVIYKFRQKKRMKIRRWLWCSLAMIFLLLSIGIIPSFIYFMQFPWHSITLFTPDVAIYLIITVVLSAINGVLAMLISLRWKPSMRSQQPKLLKCV